MANQSAKRIVQENASRISLLRKLLVSINLFYLTVRTLQGLVWTELAMYLVTLGLEFLVYTKLCEFAQAKYDPGNVLVDPGTDLAQPGLVSYMFDYLYVSWLVHLLSLMTRWAWLLYLSIPIYLVVRFGPQLRQMLMPHREEPEKEEDPKKREKRERKKQKVRYVR
ncbi:hypothetical protein GGI25_006080 [Coemansia spiralis]|uniref:DUF788-domain-containing protein n=2 Tax=Coemansia TaxID=4863 RepID=A0A9W8KU29_9FUNG|nr:hypothetical protein BX070DRAFT_237141 [Coemansia spiralis]KAJ1989440.1 hypothetical protein EDC05_004698 [Coemansia umbellata]KAJ2620351.1 hypothetical protein GGI26_005060 [Coemansia sp. RSA 1358]KAJ2669655.1 hypothetical protein GGI25_006080 [Coemansia spiralis]